MRIEIGKQGQQPFKISASGVSRIHAVVDIDDNNGMMTLSDCNSSNGTFIRDERTGVLRQISHVSITPMTFICLGTDNSKGCSFYARQLLNPGDFNEEIRYLLKKEDEFDCKLEQVERKTRLLRLSQTLIPVVVFGLSMVLWKENGMSSYLLRMIASAIPSGVLQILFDPRRQTNIIKTYHDRFRQCPNPECSHRLKPQDIRSRECPYCNKI